MTEISTILIDLFIMLAAAKIAGELFHRLHQPAVIGEILAGVVLGSFALVHHGPFYEAIAEVGVILLLFRVGLESRVSEIFKVGRVAALVAILGVALPFGLGFGTATLLGYHSVESMFLGTALVATSVGITARVLGDLGLIGSIEARIILGAAIIDDILGMVLLAIVGGLGKGTVSVPDIALISAEALGFAVFAAFVGTRVTRRYGSLLSHLRIRNAPLAVAMVVCLGLAALASVIGLAAIIGAFLAGMMFAETRDQYRLEHQVESLNEFLVPFFFVITGTLLDVRTFFVPSVLGIAALVTLVAIVGKVAGGALAASRLGGLSALIVGTGMAPRGEVGIIVAALGLGLGAITAETYGIVVFMSVATTLLAAPVLKWLFQVQARSRRMPELAKIPEGAVER